MGAMISGLIRREAYELPVEAVREMIINAHCHRNLSDSSCVQVAVYDDRLEVTSPGGLYNGLTYEEIMNGHSKLRNRTIANIFNQMGLVEAWGTGIKRIMQAADHYRLPAPEIQAFDDMFRVNLYRNSLTEFEEGTFDSVMGKRANRVESTRKFGEDSEKNQITLWNTEINDMQRSILNLIRKNNRISAKGMAEVLSVSSRAVEKNIKLLKDRGILIRHGSPKSGYWEIC